MSDPKKELRNYITVIEAVMRLQIELREAEIPEAVYVIDYEFLAGWSESIREACAENNGESSQKGF